MASCYEYFDASAICQAVDLSSTAGMRWLHDMIVIMISADAAAGSVEHATRASLVAAARFACVVTCQYEHRMTSRDVLPCSRGLKRSSSFAVIRQGLIERPSVVAVASEDAR
jgi:hypothetical protein